MTAIDVCYRYRDPLGADQMRALSQAFDVYGVRGIKVDEEARRITVEYDATRMNERGIAAILRGCGIAIEPAVG